VTDVSNVFQYGASESNGRSMGYEEQLQKSPGTAEVPPQRSGDPFDTPTEDGGDSPLTTRLILLAVTIILLGTAAGLAGALVLPKTYGARAEVLYAVGQDQQGGDPLKQGRDLSTQLVYLKSRAVLGPVATKEGRQFKDLEKAVSVEVLENSNVIEVEADGPTKLAALQTLQSVMDGYMTLIGQPTGVSRNLETQLADAKANTAQIQTRVQQLTTAVTAGTATQAALNDARAQLTGSLDREKAIQARIDELNLTGQNGPDAQLLTPPYSLPDPVFPQPLIAAGTGALVGVIVAGTVVAMSVRRRTRP
jgi:capsular polysaccharide biosynthesis protein